MRELVGWAETEAGRARSDTTPECGRIVAAHKRRHPIVAIVIAVLLLTCSVPAGTQQLPEEFEGVGITEHLGEVIDVDVPFVDQDGRRVVLREYFEGEKAVLLTLNYYECPSLCTLQLNGLLEGLRELDLSGEDFRVVTISIDPSETPQLASEKRAAYLNELGRDDIRWDFLVGERQNIDRVADAVGFGYRYDPDQDLFAHNAAAFFLSPEGRVTRYLYGVIYPARDVKFALMEASEGRVGSTIDRIIMTCFHYVDGSYAPFALGFMRLGGVVVAGALGLFLVVLWRRERRRRRVEATS